MGNTVRQLRGNDTFTIRHLTLLLVVGLLGFGWLGQQAFGQTTDGDEELFVLICVDSATGELRVAEDCADGEVLMTLASGTGLTETLALIESVEVEQSNIVRVVAEQEEAIAELEEAIAEQKEEVEEVLVRQEAELEMFEATFASAVAEVEEEVVRQEAELEAVEDTVASAVAEVEEQAIVIDDLAMAVDGLGTLTFDQATALEQLEALVAGLTPPTVAFDATENLGLTGLSTQISAPEKGILLMAGGVDAAEKGSGGNYLCRLLVNGALVEGSRRVSRVDTPIDGDVDNIQEDCTTSGAWEVEAGIHTVVFDVISGFSLELSDASVWVLWVPLDGS